MQNYKYVPLGGFIECSESKMILLVISIALGLMSQPIKFRFNSLQTTAVVPEPK